VHIARLRGRTGIDITVHLILAALTAQVMTVGLAQLLSAPGNLSQPRTPPGKHR
jgi:hypothetical protein